MWLQHREERRKCLFNNVLNTFYLQLYGIECGKGPTQKKPVPTTWQQRVSSLAVRIALYHNMSGRRKEMFYLTTHSTHFIYGYMASDIWLRTIQIARKETRCRHIGYSFQLTARVLLYAPSHRQDSTYHGLCYTSRRALAGTRNSSMCSPHEGSIRRPIAPWANTLTIYIYICLMPYNCK